MSWNNSLPVMIRSAIGDFGSPPKYSDQQLAPVILTAVNAVKFNVTPTRSYLADVEALTLTPDPTDPTINDDSFTYLVTIKATTMLLYAEVRRYGQQAIAIRDGSSAIDLKRDLKALTQLADSYSKDLTNAIYQYIRNGTLGGRVILTCPYGGLLSRIDCYFGDSRSYRW